RVILFSVLALTTDDPLVSLNRELQSLHDLVQALNTSLLQGDHCPLALELLQFPPGIRRIDPTLFVGHIAPRLKKAKPVPDDRIARSRAVFEKRPVTIVLAVAPGRRVPAVVSPTIRPP